MHAVQTPLWAQVLCEADPLNGDIFHWVVFAGRAAGCKTTCNLVYSTVDSLFSATNNVSSVYWLFPETNPFFRFESSMVLCVNAWYSSPDELK